jgi:predicted nuclease of predicted toxin-antitoxin system
VLTKDSDFVLLLEQLGSPPQVLWLTVATLRTRASERYWQGAFLPCRACFSVVSPWLRFQQQVARLCNAF